jgi:hypothetical protein
MTARPGRVVMDIPITLPRPRTLQTEFADEFKGFVETIRTAIYAERKQQR